MGRDPPRRREVELRPAIRASTYASAFLAIAAVPIVAVVAPLLAARALSRVPSVPSGRATAVAIVLVAGWALALTGAHALFVATLSEPVFELAQRAQRAW